MSRAISACGSASGRMRIARAIMARNGARCSIGIAAAARINVAS